MRTMAMMALAATAITLAGCKKTGEGEYEVQRPTVGTTTDTVRTPTVDVGTTKDTIILTRPKVEVKP